jgi:hypothetical protein
MITVLRLLVHEAVFPESLYRESGVFGFYPVLGPLQNPLEPGKLRDFFNHAGTHRIPVLLYFNQYYNS